MKTTPADFRVIEDLGFAPDGTGEHLLVQVRKCDLNTQDVVERLQRQLKLKPVDIGVCGLKDRRAVADQWISLRGVSEQAAREAVGVQFNDRLIILQSVRHGRKLRRGAHRANHFEIILRGVQGRAPGSSVAWRDLLTEQLQQIGEFGFPSYFGAQRFGINGRNLDAARQYFASGGRQRMARQRRGLLLSAARSSLFNQVCAARVQAANWLTPLPGEPLILAGTQSYFIPEVLCGGEPEPAARQRVLAGDVHTSGPLWGAGTPIAEARCLAWEQAHLADQSMLCTGLEAVGLEVHRRPLRCRPSVLTHAWLADDVLRLTVELPKGVFATSLLAELMEQIDAPVPARSISPMAV